MTIASYHALANLLVLFLLNMPNSSYFSPFPHSVCLSKHFQLSYSLSALLNSFVVAQRRSLAPPYSSS